MLIRFTASNFLSFRGDTEFSMIPAAGTDRRRHTISADSAGDMPLLQSGVIYGANASGKSNMIKAMDYARRMIVHPVDKGEGLPLCSFKLDDKIFSAPTTFEFEIRIGRKNYAYGFSFTSEEIKEEWLCEIGKSKDVELFSRNGLEIVIDKNKKFFNGGKVRDRLGFIADDLFANQLFLTMVNNRNIASMRELDVFTGVFRWFREKLTILFPHSQYRGTPIFGGLHNLSRAFDKILSGFDTGIKRTDFTEISSDKLYRKVPEEIIERIKKKLVPGQETIVSSPGYDTFLFYIDSDGKFGVKELVAYHDDSERCFEMSEESDGTKRLTDLLPLFVNFFHDKEKIIVVDELDRSLHTEITYNFMRLFFRFAKGKRIQFIFSTHDTALLDIKLFRKDEIWFVEKDKAGSSRIYSLAQFKPRDDLNLRKGYLQGRFGGIPFLGGSLEEFLESFRER